MSKKKASAISRQMDRLKVMVSSKRAEARPMQERHLTLIPALIAEGATLTWISEQPDMPSSGSVYGEIERNPEFAAAMDKAKVQHAQAILDAAKDYTRDGIGEGDFDKAKMAEILHRIAIARAEKVAPANYGVLVKHAGADGGPIQLNVINYAEVAKTKE